MDLLLQDNKDEKTGIEEPKKTETAGDEDLKAEAKLSMFNGPYKQKSVVRVDLDKYGAKDRLMKLIEDETGRIYNEYTEANYHDNIEDAEDEYNGESEPINFPTEDASNRKLLLTTLTIDIVASKGIRQTYGVAPAVTLEIEKEYLSAEQLRDRADLLDHRLRNDIHIESLSGQIYRETCKHGACIVKVPFDHKCEYFTAITTYTPDMINKFEDNYSEKLDNGDEKYTKIWRKLKNGQDVTVEEEQEIVRVHGPAPYIVDLKDFYARLKIKDFYRHTVIGEHLDMTWIDIDSRKSQNYYDEKAVDDLQTKDPKEYQNKDYRIREDVVMFDLKEDGKIRRFIVTYDEETKIVLRCIYYPYRHGKIHFVCYNAIPRKDSWLGYSFTKRMEDVVSIANAFVNSAINEFTLGHTPVVLTDDQGFQGGRITIENLSVIRFATGSKFQPMVFQPASMDRVAFLNWVVNFTELLTGVSASLMSGAETPSDPRAPYAKSALKFKSSAMRVEDVIHEMQKGDAELAEQCDKIYYQFPAKDEDTIDYYKGTDKRSLKVDIFDKNVRYVMQGSRLSFDKSQDMQVAMTTGAYIMQFHPEVWRDPEARYELLNIVLNSSEGAVEKRKDAIIKPLREYIDTMRKIKEMQNEAKGMQGQGANPKVDQGLRDRIARMKEMQSGSEEQTNLIKGSLQRPAMQPQGATQ